MAYHIDSEALVLWYRICLDTDPGKALTGCVCRSSMLGQRGLDARSKGLPGQSPSLPTERVLQLLQR